MYEYSPEQLEGITAAKDAADAATDVEVDDYLTDLLVKAYPTKVTQDN